MCRNIRTLYNFEPPATDEEIRAAALQYVRKISGFNKPSQANAEAFGRAIDAVASAEGHALGREERPLALTLGQRSVGAHHTVPRNRRVLARVQHRAGHARGTRRDVAVGPHEADRDRADPREDSAFPIGAHAGGAYGRAGLIRCPTPNFLLTSRKAGDPSPLGRITA